MKNHFLELFSALVLTNTPPLITPISPIFYHPFPFFSPFHSLLFLPPFPCHSPAFPSLFQSVIFAIFNPSNFPLKFRHIFIGSFRLYSHIFPTTFYLKLHIFKRLLNKRKVNKIFTICSYCCNKFMIML